MPKYVFPNTSSGINVDDHLNDFLLENDLQGIHGHVDPAQGNPIDMDYFRGKIAFHYNAISSGSGNVEMLYPSQSGTGQQIIGGPSNGKKAFLHDIHSSGTFYDSASFQANADSGFTFKEWRVDSISGSIVGTNAQLDILVDETNNYNTSQSFYAIFDGCQLVLNATSESCALVLTATGEQCGVTFTATNNTNCNLVINATTGSSPTPTPATTGSPTPTPTVTPTPVTASPTPTVPTPTVPTPVTASPTPTVPTPTPTVPTPVTSSPTPTIPVPTPTPTVTPTPTPVTSSPTPTVTPTPTPTVASTSTCKYVFVPNSVSTGGKGLRYSNNGEQNVAFEGMLGTSTYENGTEGTVYGICATNSPSWLDINTNTTTALPTGVSVIQTGGSCTYDNDCNSYTAVPTPSAPAPTPTPTAPKAPTTTAETGSPTPTPSVAPSPTPTPTVPTPTPTIPVPTPTPTVTPFYEGGGGDGNTPASDTLEEDPK